jgi:hypothetical protein
LATGVPTTTSSDLDGQGRQRRLAALAQHGVQGRQRQRLGTVGNRHRRRDRSRRLRDGLGQAPHGRLIEQHRHREFDAQDLADPGDHLRGHQ